MASSDVRLMFDNNYLYAIHLEGREHVVEIEEVKGAVLVAEGNRKTRKPILHFKGKKLPLAINKTNAKILVAMFGTTDTRRWVGQRITIYPTTTKFGKETVDCIRVRPVKPQGEPDTRREGPPAREPGDDTEDVNRGR